MFGPSALSALHGGGPATAEHERERETGLHFAGRPAIIRHQRPAWMARGLYNEQGSSEHNDSTEELLTAMSSLSVV